MSENSRLVSQLFVEFHDLDLSPGAFERAHLECKVVADLLPPGQGSRVDEPVRGGHLLEQVIVFLLFIGAAQVVNRLAKRPVMNGAAWYLIAAVFVYTNAVDRGRLALDAQSHRLTETMRLHLFAEMMLRSFGNMLLPACVAIYYARKFSKARAAAASHLSART